MDKIKIILTNKYGVEVELTGEETRQTVSENKTAKSTTITTDRHFMLTDGSGYSVKLTKTISHKN